MLIVCRLSRLWNNIKVDLFATECIRSKRTKTMIKRLLIITHHQQIHYTTNNMETLYFIVFLHY